jgi:hypothetical protein
MPWIGASDVWLAVGMLLLKVTLLLGCVWFVGRFLRRRAALQHWVLLAGLASVYTLPLVMALSREKMSRRLPRRPIPAPVLRQHYKKPTSRALGWRRKTQNSPVRYCLLRSNGCTVPLRRRRGQHGARRVRQGSPWPDL